MNAIDFMSAKVVVAFPSKSNPKVYLAIDNPEISRISFKLYNPFSLKGKVFKSVVRFLCIYANGLVKHIMPTLKGTHSPIIEYAEQEIGKKITSSVYVATANDKFVVQLVDNNEIVGYLKYPLTDQGEIRLRNEREGIKILASEGLLSNLYYEGVYQGVDFIILKNIEGSIGKVEKSDYSKLLESFNKPKSYMLREHPRVVSLLSKSRNLKLKNLEFRIDYIMGHSQLKYNEVYEHGDFTPWNLIMTRDGLVPFDFEYFVEEGLAYFDEFKYHYQIATLLESKSGKSLLDTIKSIVKLDEFTFLFELFLIKEIIIKKEEGKLSDLESALLIYLDNEKK